MVRFKFLGGPGHTTFTNWMYVQDDEWTSILDVYTAEDIGLFKYGSRVYGQL